MKKLLLVVAGCAFALTSAFAQSAGWMNPAWMYRSPVAVSNPNGAILTQFQVNIRLGSETDFTKIQPKGADLRMTAADGVTQIPFWIESFNAASSTASIWVKIPSIPPLEPPSMSTMGTQPQLRLRTAIMSSSFSTILSRRLASSPAISL